MRSRWGGALLAAVLLAASGAAGGPPEKTSSGDAIKGLSAWLEGTRDLTSHFEQRLLSGAFGAGALESGVFYLQRPGRLRWEYKSPEPKTAIVEGDRTFLYLPEDRQLIRGRLTTDQDLLPALLAGNGKLADLFEVRVLHEADAAATAPVRIRLVPRSAPEGVQEVILTVRPPAFAIERAEVLDPAGNRMEYVFTKVRRNAGLAESVFAFEPPPGTEIVGSP